MQAIRMISPEKVVRGQYDGYRDEDGVDPESDTETFVAIEVEIDNWRWAGVPFYLRTGKCMAESRHLVALDFREPPMRMFPNEVQHQGANQLVFELSEPGSITADFQAKVPGATMELGPARMTFNYEQSFCAENQLEAYERLIHDAMLGDGTLFTSAEGIERLWAISADVLEHPPAVHPLRAGIVGAAAGRGADRAVALAAPGDRAVSDNRTERTHDMSATKDLHDAGQSLWLDYITRDAVNDGTIEGYVARSLADRPDLEPDDLRPGAERGRRLRRADLGAARGGQDRRGPVLRARAARPARRLRPVRRDPPAHRRRRRLGVARGLAAARSRHRRHRRRGRRACTPPAIATTSSSRSRAPPRGCRRSRRRSPPAPRST